MEEMKEDGQKFTHPDLIPPKLNGQVTMQISAARREAIDTRP
jgi:hypothetical protein